VAAFDVEVRIVASADERVYNFWPVALAEARKPMLGDAGTYR